MMAVKNEVWSLDDGYGDNKLFNGEKEIIIPSHCTNWIKQLRDEELNDSRRVDPFSHIGVEIEGTDGKYLVGEGALAQDPSLNWAGGANKHKDFYFPIIAKTCLGIMAGREPKVEVDTLVMGLPVNKDESKERHALLEEVMVGTHKLNLHLANGSYMSKEVVVKDLVTKKQPFGSFCDLILDNNGDITDMELAGSFTVIVDIGTRTLNVYTLDALSPITELSDTQNQGVHVAYDFVNDFITDRLGFKVATGKIAGVVRKGEIRGIDLNKVISLSYKQLANEVFKIVDTMFVDSWVFVDNIIVTGGGAEILKHYLTGMFPVEPVFLNRYSTVRGFRKYGVRHYNSKQKKQSQPTTVPESDSDLSGEDGK